MITDHSIWPACFQRAIPTGVALVCLALSACTSVVEDHSAGSSAAASTTTGGTGGASSATGSTTGDGGASTGVGGAGGSGGTGGVADCSAPTITAIATEQADIRAIALDDTNIYWTTYVDSKKQGQIRTMPKAGGSVTILATTPQVVAKELAVDATHVYWSGSSSVVLNGTTYKKTTIYSVIKGGGLMAAKELASTFGAFTLGFAIDQDRVYWLIPGDAVYSVPKAGNAGVTTVLPHDPKNIVYRHALAADQDHLYFLEGAVQVLTMPSSGGVPALLATTMADPPVDTSTFALDGKRVYWGNAEVGHVTSVSKGGGPVTTHVAGKEFVSTIAVNSACVYWTTVGAQPDEVRAAPKSGGDPITIAQLTNQLGAVLAADEKHVYWEDRWTKSLMQATK